jgi:hypothetical protein
MRSGAAARFPGGEQMGHSTIQMTMDTYGHLFKDDAGDRSRLKAIEASMLAAGVVKDA